MSDDKTRTDLTRLENIQAFLHEEDDEVNSKLETYSDPNQAQDNDDAEEQLPSLEDLEDDDSFEAAQEPEEFPEEDEPNNEFPSLPENEDSEELFEQLEENDEPFPSFELQEESTDEVVEEVEFPPQEDDQNYEESSFEESNELEDNTFNDELPLLSDSEEETSLDSEELFEEEVSTTETIIAPPVAQRENFQDLRRFSENITYGNVALGGNPPFSIVLKKIKYHEDGEAIISILEEHGLINDQNKQVMSMSIEHGTLLLSQLSEYAAIYLCHKLRRFNLEIMMGLSEEIRPSKSYENEEKGLISKSNLKQNKVSHHEFKQNDVKQENIILSLNSHLDGMQVMRYIDIISSHKIVYEYEIRQTDEDTQEQEHHDLNQSELFEQLKERLRSKAFALKANAVIGINFQMTPITEGENREFKITCTGNAVWLIDSPGANG